MKPDNSIIVIFGASGDLTARKLIPAYYTLYKNGMMPESYRILGIGRSSYNDEAFREKQRQFLPHDESEASRIESFLDTLSYQTLDTKSREAYGTLAQRIELLTPEAGNTRNVLYYLATPPSMYAPIAEYLSEWKLNSEEDGWKRLVIEKPFGYDRETAKELDSALHRYFAESQLYRIDHYLGKETVQNLLVFRFANGLFEPMWSRMFIDYVEITSSEFIGVENRGGYYDGSGAVRDMLQNHLLQVLALTAMEPPTTIDAKPMRDEVLKVVQSLRPLSAEDVEKNLVLGQYTAANVRGEHLDAYRDEDGVDPASRTETFAALKLFIDNWRWNGVPFYVRTGKRLPTRVTEVVIHFKNTPHPVFAKNNTANMLVLRIQPDEGILIKFGLKKPGSGFETQEVSMDFHYEDLHGSQMLSAYERLLLDAAKGDATLFARSDVVHACWDFIQPVLDYKNGEHHQLYGYAAGTWGPKEAQELMEGDACEWRYPCKNLTDVDYCEL